MGRKMEGLEVKVPSFFKCPISMEVMRSPVSLCTGVTYDRDSIQRWIDSGNMTCPATNLPLPSTDLVPNLTLRRLIALWSFSPFSPSGAADLRRALDFLRDPDRDDFEKRGLISSTPFRAAIVDGGTSPKTRLRAADLAIYGDFADEAARRAVISALASDIPRSAAAFAAVMRSGSSEGQICAARVLEAILSSDWRGEGAGTLIADDAELIAGLIQLIGSPGSPTVVSGLTCLVLLSEIRRSRQLMVSLGLVPAIAKILSNSIPPPPQAAVQRSLRLMEAASACAEGREEICAAAVEVVTSVMEKMMKGGRDGAEAATAALWNVCCRHRDERAVAALTAEVKEALSKILLVMQSGCSTATRQMAGDLLKIFRVDSKSCLGRYDTNTAHIMPY